MKRSAITGLLIFQAFNFTESQPESLDATDMNKIVKETGGLCLEGVNSEYDNLVDHHSQYSGSQNVYKFLNFEFSYNLKTGLKGYYHSGNNEMGQY